MIPKFRAWPRTTVALSLLLALTTAACSRQGAATAATDAGTVTVIGPSGVFADNYRKFIIEPFEASHPGIRVAYQPSPNSAQTMALLTMQRVQPQIDVAVLDVAVAIRAAEQALLAPLDRTRLSHLQDYPDWARLPGDRGVAFSQDNLAVLYNTDKIKQPPTSWKDLADPRYKGRIAAKLTDTRGVILLPILGKVQGTDYKVSVDPAFALLDRIAANVSTWEPAPDCYAVVQSGEADLSICWNARAQYLHDTQGGKIGVTVPKEGTVGQINTIGRVAGSPRADQATAFIDYALSPEAQTAFAVKSYYGPVNTRVTLPDGVATRIHGGGGTAMTLDWNWISDRYSAWIQRINREVILAH